MLNRNNSILIFLFCTCAVNLYAKIIRVPSDQPNIQQGIYAASDGDTVLVYPGTYFENINFKGKKIVVTSRFFETGDLNFINSTIINGSRPVNSDTASCVIFISGEDSAAVLQGFTITSGKGTKWIDEHGAGTYREGGGILVAKSSPTIRYNVIINNDASDKTGVTSSGGGGIRAGDGNPEILNNFITGNKGRYGAGIVLNYTGAIVRNNIITNNSGGQDYGGGALWMNHDGSSPKLIENNTFTSNKVVDIYVWQGTSVIKNCILWADPTTSAVQIIVRSGGPVVTYSNVLGGWNGTGNIFSDPQFADTAFTLKDISPCIDAGDSSAEYYDPEDSLLKGSALFPSHGSLRNDMGAYGGPGTHLFPYINVSTSVRSSANYIPAEYQLNQNYPNPFNPTTFIEYSLKMASEVEIEIFNTAGQKVAALFNGYREAGSYREEWNAKNFASGIYLYRIRAGEFMQVKKMIYLK